MKRPVVGVVVPVAAPWPLGRTRQTFEVDIESAVCEANFRRDPLKESARRVAARVEQRRARAAAEAEGFPPGFRSWADKHQGGRGRPGSMGRNMYSETLTYEKIFNGDLHPWGNLQAAQSAATSCGYPFLLFEGHLYTTDRYTGAWSLVPAVTKAALAEGEAAVIELRDTIRKRDEKIDQMARGHQRLHTELDKALGRAKAAEDRAERQRQIIDSLRAGNAA